MKNTEKQKMENWETTTSYSRFQSGYNYNERIGYYSETDENERMYIGDQWYGVDTGGIPEIVCNVEKRIGEYKISAISSNRIKAVYGIEGIAQFPYGTPLADLTEEEAAAYEINRIASIMSGNAEIMWERLGMDSLVRRCLRDGFVTGDWCAYTYWDSEIETGTQFKGNFVTERVNGGNVFFGNPNEANAQKQPWIILLIRDTVDNFKKLAEREGVKKEDIERIVGDNSTDTQLGEYGQIEIEGDESTQKCNGFIMFYRDSNGICRWNMSTQYVNIISDRDNKTGKRYPVDWANWDERENCYHGVAECTQIHPNQRYINKMFALCMVWFMYNSFGRVAIDVTRISSWSNNIAEAIAIEGPVTNAIQQLSSGDFNTAILTLIQYVINYTKECQGVTDAALGVERADNTSALVIAQKASALPLENQQARLYKWIEDVFLTWAAYMNGYYLEGRQIPYKDNDGVIKYETFTKKDAERLAFNVRIEVGSSSYWSEITNIEQIDQWLKDQRITFIQALEMMPNGYINNKQKLIDELKAMADQMQSETDKTNDEEKQKQFEMQAAFFDTLPAETQQYLQSLPDDQMEAELMQMMQGQTQMS